MSARLSFASMVMSVPLLFCGEAGLRARDLQTIKTGEIEGVIVDEATAASWGVLKWGTYVHAPGTAEGFWTPTAQDVEAAEGHLRAALEKGVKDPGTIMPEPLSEESRRGSARTVEIVLETGERRHRQYFGVIIDGKKWVYLSAFPVFDPMHERDHFVHVIDGGTWYWRIFYCVDTGTFGGFSVNGGM